MVLGLALLTGPMLALLSYFLVLRLREAAVRPVAVLAPASPSDLT